MCIVCALWEKGKLTAKEADRALVELIETNKDITNEEFIHVQEALINIEKDNNGKEKKS